MCQSHVHAFFFSWSGDHRDLHSFPTRRSSDLRQAQATRSGFHAAGLSAFITCAYQDRKSTRLNSSHVAISYAVFCLKKKNITFCHQDIRNKTAPAHTRAINTKARAALITPSTL